MLAKKIEARRRHDLEPLVLGKILNHGFDGAQIVKLCCDYKERPQYHYHWSLKVKSRNDDSKNEYTYTVGLTAMLTINQINDIFGVQIFL